MHHGEIPDNPPSSTIIRVLRQVNVQNGDKSRLHFITVTITLPFYFILTDVKITYCHEEPERLALSMPTIHLRWLVHYDIGWACQVCRG